jgi:hypothetical protein
MEITREGVMANPQMDGSNAKSIATRWADSFPLAKLIFFCAAILIAGSFTTLLFLPTQDGPVHLYYSVVLADLLRGGHTFAAAFQIRNLLSPYAFHSYLLILLNKIVDPLMSERIVEAIAIVWLAAGCWRLARALHGPQSAMQMLFLPFLSTWTLYMGLFNFVLGVGTLLYLTGWWLDNEQENLAGWRLAFFFSGIILLASMHPVPLAMFFLFAGILLVIQVSAALTKRGANPAVLWQILGTKANPLICLFLASSVFLWIRHFVTANQVASPFSAGGEIVFRLLKLLSLHEVSPLAPEEWRETSALVGAMLVSALLVIRRIRRRTFDLRLLAVATMAAACLVIYLVAPRQVNGSFLFERRFSTVFCFLFVAIASGDPAVSARLRLLISLFALTAALTVTLVQRRNNLDNVASLEPVVAGARLRSGSRILEIQLGSPQKTVLHYDPWAAAASYWCLRSSSEFVNMPWMELDIMMIKPAVGVVPPVDSFDAGMLIRNAVDSDRAVLPFSPDGLAIERSSDKADEENQLVNGLTQRYHYKLVSPANSELILLARPTSLEAFPTTQISVKGF